MLTRTAAKALRAPMGVRFKSTATIVDALKEVIPPRAELLKELRTGYGDKSVGEVTLSQVFGGQRGIKALLWEPSVLDAEHGIRFWGRSIPEVQALLPTADDGTEMLPEAMFWYLLTGKVPSKAETAQFQSELVKLSILPEYVIDIIDSLPKDLHPMTQFVIGIASLNHESVFAKAYREGINKKDYWEPTLTDSLNVVAKGFTIAARIYANIYNGGAKNIPDVHLDRDLVWNFCNQIGFGDKPGFIDFMRLYNSIHTDHEGGNVSAHTAHLVGSALSDPALAFSASLAGLAGPLHGLANQEVLRFILATKDAVGDNPSDQEVVDYIWSVLKSGRVLPGYGHAVLRKPDPRFVALVDFGKARPDVAANPVFNYVTRLFKLAPGVLTEQGKTKNPWPNVDSGSGALLYHYGLTQFDFYTVTFGTSRALGALSQLVWDRALGLPIERPKSLNLEGYAELVGYKK